MDAITALQSNRQRTRSIATTTISAHSTGCGTITVNQDDSGGGGDNDDDSQFPGGGGGGGNGDYGDNFPGGDDGTDDNNGGSDDPTTEPEQGNALPVSNLALAGGIGGIALIGLILSI